MPDPTCPRPRSSEWRRTIVSHSRALRARSWRTALATAALMAGVLVAPVSAQSPGRPPAAASPNCGTEPVELLAYFETGFALPQALANEFTKQFPNVTWNIREDQFTNLMKQTPRLLVGRQPARPHPPAVDGRPGQGRAAPQPRAVRHSVRLGQVVPGDAVAEPRGRERPRGDGSLYAAGLNYARPASSTTRSRPRRSG